MKNLFKTMGSAALIALSIALLLLIGGFFGLTAPHLK